MLEELESTLQAGSTRLPLTHQASPQIQADEPETTLERINRLAEERLALYRLASQRSMTEEERQRIEEITRELEHLWDQLRRERAARRYAREMTQRRDLRMVA